MTDYQPSAEDTRTKIDTMSQPKRPLKVGIKKRDFNEMKAKERKRMVNIIPKEQLQNGYLFQGGEYGGIPISFFWVQASPGKGPRLHKHPYEEIFVVLEGHATFTVGDNTIEVDGGHIVIGPANVPHKFINSGEGTLRQITIHPNKEVITEWLEDE